MYEKNFFVVVGFDRFVLILIKERLRFVVNVFFWFRARDVKENLQAALEQFNTIQEDLEEKQKTNKPNKPTYTKQL